MNRRVFLGTLLGAGAGLALPSEVWPFRKIFLPFWRTWAGTNILRPSFNLFDDSEVFPESFAAKKKLNDIVTLQLEQFQKAIPDLVYKSTPLYRYIKSRRTLEVMPNGAVFVDQIAGINYIQVPPQERLLLKAGIYPASEGEHGPELLHAKATPENIVRWFDDVEKSVSRKT